MKKGVYPVDLFGIVRRLQNTEGNSSTQAPAALWRGVNSLFLTPLVMRPLARSTWPLVYGCATKAKFSLVPCSSQYFWSSSVMELEPLAVMML